MSSIQATRLRKGMLIKFQGELYRVEETQHKTPGNLRAAMHCKLRSLQSGKLADHRFRADEDVERARLDEREMQFMYRDGDLFHFMDTSTYEQVHLSREELGENALYLLAEALINVEFYEGTPMGVELPPTVDLKVVDTSPGIKGATASNQVKPATL